MKYECYTPLAPKLAAQIIEAPSSFEARKQYAAQHTAMELSDVCARRVRTDWEHFGRCIFSAGFLAHIQANDPELYADLYAIAGGHIKEPFYSKAAGCWIDLA